MYCRHVVFLVVFFWLHEFGCICAGSSFYMVVCTQTCEFTFVAKGSQALKRCEISDEKERRKAEWLSYVRALLFYFSGEKPKARHNFYSCLMDYNIYVHLKAFRA